MYEKKERSKKQSTTPLARSNIVHIFLSPRQTHLSSTSQSADINTQLNSFIHSPSLLHLPKMVKFSKELEAQLIPEWKEAFVNYWQLKKCVKKIKLSQKTKQSTLQYDYPADDGTSKYTVILRRCAMLGPLRTCLQKIIAAASCRHSYDITADIIQVNETSMISS